MNLTKSTWRIGTRSYREYGIPSGPGAEFFFAFLATQRTSAIVKGLVREVMSSGGRRGMCLLMRVVEVGFGE